MATRRQDSYGARSNNRVPDPFEQVGQGCFAQLITANRHLWRTVTNQQAYTHFIKDWWNGIEALDAAFPYPKYGPNSSVWTLPNKGYAYDTPRQPLSWSSQHTQYWYKSSANDSFRTWAFYKPPQKDGQPVIWIPMAQIAWAWNGLAERDPYPSGPWVLRSGTGSATQASATDVFPEWNKYSPSPFGFVGVQ